MPIVSLMLCTNDERGHDTGYATCVELHRSSECVLRLECCAGWLPRDGVRCYWRGTHCIQFGRLRLGVLKYQDWVGNWCWSAVWLSFGEAKRALRYLYQTGRFEAESGWTTALKWWDGMAERAVVDKPAHNTGKPFAIAHADEPHVGCA